MSSGSEHQGRSRRVDERRVTERIEREELARGHVAPGEPPAEPRPASTIVLARRGGNGHGAAFEVLLLERPRNALFAAGAFVFAGGVIDEGDAAPELRGLLPADVDEEEIPALVAGLRELFEETGLLPADAPIAVDAAERARLDLLSGRCSFSDVAKVLELRFERLRVAYFARWVTPARFARRYDTRFFLAEAGATLAGAEPALTDELAGHIWLSPREAVDRFAAGSLPMLFPTRTTLSRLALFPDLEAAFEAYATAAVTTTQPRLLVRGDSVRPVLPGDPEYGEAT